MNGKNSAIIIDTEWGYRNGRIGCESAFIPVVLCAFVLSSGQEHVFLPGKDDRRLEDFLCANRDAVFVAHSATAEMKYLLRLGMSIPGKWYDTMLAERWLANSPLHPEVSLVKSLDRHELSRLAPLEKEDMRQKILQLNFDSDNKWEMDGIAEYCMQDCRACAALFQRQRGIPENRNRLDRLMSWWPIYLEAVAKMELRGIPFDAPAYRTIIANQEEIRARLADEINAVAPVMAPSGINRVAFRKFCIANHIPLPRKYDKVRRKMKFSVENEALKEIEHWHPLIPKTRETSKTLTALRSNRMVMDFLPREVMVILHVGKNIGLERPGHYPVDEFMVGGGVPAHQFHCGPVFPSRVRVHVEPCEPG